MKYKGFNIFLLLCFSALVLPAQNTDKVELIATFDKQFEYLDSLLNHQFTDFCSPLQEFEANTLSERINNMLNSSYKCNGIHINNLFKFFVWCEVSKSFTRSII